MIKYYYFSKLNTTEQVGCYYRIFSFLKDLIWEYPAFQTWYNNLFTEKKTLKKCREMIFCIKEEILMGVVILKKTEKEQKICTLKVDERYRKMGLGQSLLERSFNWLHSDKPLLTVRASRRKDFTTLLTHYNFQLKQIDQVSYGSGKTELVFNGILEQNDKDAILLSIKPEFSEQILAGNKRYEYRKKLCRENINKIYIYETFPTQRIVGNVDVIGKLKKEKEKLWEQTYEFSGMRKEQYDWYFRNVTMAGAYKLGKVIVYEQPKQLKDIDINFSPQSYVYVAKQKIDEILLG